MIFYVGMIIHREEHKKMSYYDDRVYIDHRETTLGNYFSGKITGKHHQGDIISQ